MVTGNGCVEGQQSQLRRLVGAVGGERPTVVAAYIGDAGAVGG